MKKTALLIALSVIAASASAIEDTPENREREAKRYLKATPPVELINDLVEQVTATLSPDEGAEYREMMTVYLDINSVETAILKAMVKYFTADEIKAMADFYGSPVGKSATAKMAGYTMETMKKIQLEIALAKDLAERETNLSEPQGTSESGPFEEDKVPILKIDPDKKIFGVKYGATEDEFVAKYGKPEGILQMDADMTAMIYGKRIAFIFQSKKLNGVEIAPNSFLHGQLTEEMTAKSVFDNVKWELTNGIKEGMSRPEIKEIIGDDSTHDYYRWRYETDIAVVLLIFSHYTDEGMSESAYKVQGITIRKK